MKRSSSPLLALALVVLVLVTFGRALGYEFVWDDKELILNNPALTPDAGWATLFNQDMWWLGGSGEAHHGFWRPLTILYFKALTHLAGPSALVFHAGSLLLHVAASLLAFVALAKRLGDRLAFFAAALFAVHPLRVESVVWVSGAGDQLCACFLLLALLGHLRARTEQRWSGVTLFGSASVFAYLLAGLSKELAYVFPLFLVVHACLPEDRRAGDKSLRKWALIVPYLIVTGALLAWRAQVVEPMASPFSWAERVLTGTVLLARYLGEMVLPVGRTLQSAMQPVSSIADARFAAALVGVALIGGVAVAHRAGAARRVAPLAAWVLVFLAPVCAIGFARTLFSERYTYAPALAMSVLVALAVERGHRRAAQVWAPLGRMGTSLAIGVLLGLVLVTSLRMGAWRDDGALFAEMLRENPGNDMALYNLGMREVDRGDLGAAAPLFIRAVTANPSNAGAWNSLGNLAYLSGDLASAAVNYQRALDAGNLSAGFNLGKALERLDRCAARLAYQDFVRRATPDLAGHRAIAEERLRTLVACSRPTLEPAEPGR